jgi:hypothetical protein
MKRCDHSSKGFMFTVLLAFGVLWSPVTASPDSIKKGNQPFQAALCTQVATTTQCGATPSSFTVPADRWAVIEYASGRCPRDGITLSTGETWFPMLQTTVGGVVASHLLHPTPGMAIGSPQLVSALQLGGFDVAQPARIYADPGSVITLLLDVGGLGSADISCNITISGHTEAP